MEPGAGMLFADKKGAMPCRARSKSSIDNLQSPIDNPRMHDSTDANEYGAAPVNTKRGTISVLSGCMFSGKTTELLRRLERIPPRSILVFKHVIDTRYEPDAVVSHGGKAVAAIRISSATEIADHVSDGVEMVAVDEGHFFDGGLVVVARDLASRGRNVIITLLDQDSWGRPFLVAERLCEIADEAAVLRAACAKCGAIADHTQRRTPIVDGNLVGGPESYEPRCRICWTAPPELPPSQWP